MNTKRTSPVKKRVSKKPVDKTNWPRLMTIMIVVAAFVVGIMYAGGCGSDNSGTTSTETKTQIKQDLQPFTMLKDSITNTTNNQN